VARTPFSRPHCDYVLVGRRAALGRGFDTMLDDLKSALKRLDAQLAKRAGTAG
jgi:ribonuclease P protein component